MAPVSLAPITLTDATLTIGADDFTVAVDSVTFAPQVEYAWIAAGMRNPTSRFPLVRAITWTCTIGYAQDVATNDSLTRYFLGNVGARRAVVFTPAAGDDAPAVTADVLIFPGRVGGRADEGTLTAEAELPLFGSPVLS